MVKEKTPKKIVKKKTVKKKKKVNFFSKLQKKFIDKRINSENRLNPHVLMIVTFLTGILLIISSYAWFSASLDVQIKFFDLSVSSDSGLFISLDGINFSDNVEVNLDTVITDLRNRYPNHVNQWSAGGLWPVSSNGIRNSNMDKFDVFVGEVNKINRREEKRQLNVRLAEENNSSAGNVYIAFDIFLKNVSGSPKDDNLYLRDGTYIEFHEETEEDIADEMTNIMNSMRFGFVKMGSVSSKSDISIIQNIKCDSNCQSVIYEPNSLLHSVASIEKAQTYGITMVDGVYTPTYGVIKEGNKLEHTNGHPGSGFPLDAEHFALQKTITSFENPIFTIPNGITKVRCYVWIEGQDIDSLETHSKGAGINLGIDFEKDLAGYE